MMSLTRELQQIDDMLGELMAPSFTFTMARGRLAASLRSGQQNDAMARGAYAAMQSSAKEIRRIVLKYAEMQVAEAALNIQTEG